MGCQRTQTTNLKMTLQSTLYHSQCSPPSLQPDIHVTEVVQMESECTMEVTEENIENIEIIDYSPNR